MFRVERQLSPGPARPDAAAVFIDCTGRFAGITEAWVRTPTGVALLSRDEIYRLCDAVAVADPDEWAARAEGLGTPEGDMSTKGQGDACHYADGTHRGTAASANGRELEQFEARMRAHLADGHRHRPDPDPQYGGWASAIDYRMDQTGTCHYQVGRRQGDLRVVSFACGVQSGDRAIYAGGTYATRAECEEKDGTRACRRCLAIEAEHPATPDGSGVGDSDG